MHGITTLCIKYSVDIYISSRDLWDGISNLISEDFLRLVTERYIVLISHLGYLVNTLVSITLEYKVYIIMSY